MASSSHIKPGEKGKIKAKINVMGRNGYISKSVKVFSNDPKFPLVNLVIKAFIDRQNSK